MGLEIVNVVPQAVVMGISAHAPPPVTLPISVTRPSALKAQGTRLPQEKACGEVRQNRFRCVIVSLSSS